MILEPTVSATLPPCLIFKAHVCMEKPPVGGFFVVRKAQQQNELSIKQSSNAAVRNDEAACKV